MWYWQKHRHIEKWNRIENLEIVLQNSQLTFDRSANTIQWSFLYQFPVSAVNQYHKLGGLKQYKFIIIYYLTVLAVRNSKMGLTGYIIKVLAGSTVFFLKALGESQFPAFSSFQGHLHSLAHGPSSNGITPTSASVISFPSDSDPPVSLLQEFLLLH